MPSLASTQEKEQWFPKGDADYLLYWVQWALWQPALLFPWRGLCDPGMSNQLHSGVVLSPSWYHDALSTRWPSLLSPQFFSDARDLESF